MTNPINAPASREDSSASRQRLWWIVIAIAAAALAFTLYNMWRESAVGVRRPFAWLTPTATLCIGIAGVIGRRNPGLARVIIALSLLLAAGALVEVIRW